MKRLHKNYDIRKIFCYDLIQVITCRRSNIIEGITSDFQKDSIGSSIENDYDSEGAKILKMLESAAEPELLMAEMSPEQLALFSKYQVKVEVHSYFLALMRF